MAEIPWPNRRFASNLRARRAAAGLSQEELASRADINRTQISLFEGGHRLPRLDTLVKLAGALDTTLDDMVDGTVWEPCVHQPGRFMPAAGEGGDA
jgi:transcriptional regulator with XRE-family HTH domain